MKYATTCDTGRRKEINEDSIATAVFEDGHHDSARDVGAFVLADGAGGEERGDVASYIATTTILERLSAELYPLLASGPERVGVDLSDATTGASGEAATHVDRLLPDRPSPAEIESILRDAVRTAHRRILAYARESAVDNVYTTVVAGVYADGRLHYAWVGDSPAYVVNVPRRTIDRLTRDHSRVQQLEDEGLVDDAEAKVHLEGNQISRALGGKASHSLDRPVEVDTNSVPLYDSDVVVFTSDGLVDAYPHIDWLYRRYQNADQRERTQLSQQIWDTTVTDDEIRDLLLESLGERVTETGLDRAARTLVAAGNNRGGKDNMSLILFSSETAGDAPEKLPERGPDSESAFEDLSGQTVIESSGSRSGNAGENGARSSQSKTQQDAGGRDSASDPSGGEPPDDAGERSSPSTRSASAREDADEKRSQSSASHTQGNVEGRDASSASSAADDPEDGRESNGDARADQGASRSGDAESQSASAPGSKAHRDADEQRSPDSSGRDGSVESPSADTREDDGESCGEFQAHASNSPSQARQDASERGPAGSGSTSSRGDTDEFSRSSPDSAASRRGAERQNASTPRSTSPRADDGNGDDGETSTTRTDRSVRTDDATAGSADGVEFPITDLSDSESAESGERAEQSAVLASVSGQERYEVTDGTVVDLRRGGLDLSTGSDSGHAMIERTGSGEWRITDLGTGQSTYVLTKQGTRVETRLDGSDGAAESEATLSDGAIVALGKTTPRNQYEFRRR